jgi:hypothetical protein
VGFFFAIFIAILVLILYLCHSQFKFKIMDDKIMNEKINRLADELVRIGLNILDNGESSYHKRVGNILQLIGSILPEETDIKEIDDYLIYFSAKKVIQSTNIEAIYFARKISESPKLMKMISGIIDFDNENDGDDSGGDTTNNDCDSCPVKDYCTDKHCSKSNSTDSPEDEDKPTKKPRKPRKPRKPKQ